MHQQLAARRADSRTVLLEAHRTLCMQLPPGNFSTAYAVSSMWLSASVAEQHEAW